jgi:hypothetical protein
LWLVDWHSNEGTVMMEAQVTQMWKLPLVMISGKNSLIITHACAFQSSVHLWPVDVSGYPISTELSLSQTINFSFSLGTSLDFLIGSFIPG